MKMVVVQCELRTGRHGRGGEGRGGTWRGGSGRAGPGLDGQTVLIVMRHSPLSIAPSPRRTRSGCRLAPLPHSSRLRTRDAVLTSSPFPPAPPTEQLLQTGPCILGEGHRWGV